MIMARFLREQVLALIGGDENNLNKPDGPRARFALISAPFTFAPDLTLSDLTIDPPNFPGDFLVFTSTDELSGWDVSWAPGGEVVVLTLDTVTVQKFIYTSVLTEPTTIYGLALLANDPQKLYAVSQFNPPLEFFPPYSNAVDFEGEVQWLDTCKLNFPPQVFGQT